MALCLFGQIHLMSLFPVRKRAPPDIVWRSSRLSGNKVSKTIRFLLLEYPPLKLLKLRSRSLLYGWLRQDVYFAAPGTLDLQLLALVISAQQFFTLLTAKLLHHLSPLSACSPRTGPRDFSRLPPPLLINKCIYHAKQIELNSEYEINIQKATLDLSKKFLYMGICAFL